VSEAQADASRQAAAAYLRELLLRPGRYRRLWEQYAERSRPGQVNQLAIAEVLAHHLWEHPRTAADGEVLARQLKDTVLRAVSGRLLSKSTLTLFIDAFGMPELEQERLRKLWDGSSRISVLSGPHAMAPEVTAEVVAALGPARHQTVSVHDHHLVGRDGLAVRTRTLQVVEAIADGIDRIPYIYDTNALTLELGQGCKGLDGYLQRISGDIYKADILLAKPLGLGETLTLEYVTSFHYPDEPEEQRDDATRQYRRATRRRMESFDIRVEFHPDKLPENVWWAIWNGMEGEVIAQEEADLDSQHAAHRYLRSIENTVVGFHWAWPEGPLDGDRASS